MTVGYRTADATVSAYDAAAVTPNDSTTLRATRGLWVGTGGNVKVTFASGAEIVISNVQDGTLLPIQVTVVHSTSTTASNILALY